MKLKHLPALRRHLGSRWLAGRAFYGIKLRSGAMRRRLPARSWDDELLVDALSNPALADAERYLDYRRTAAPRFFFTVSQRESFAPLLKKWDDNARNPIALADAVGRGVIRYFGHTDAGSSFPPDWHRNPFTGEQAPPNLHWSDIGDFGCGDIKVIWEPSRFGFAFALVRAYWRTGDERYAELFWQLVKNWRDANQPQQGANWKCGQEASFRTMAWCFGLHGFLDAESSSAERVAGLAQVIAATGRRIEANISYALNQQNNHGISEGVGLWTIGTLFPELREASNWRALGERVLEAEGRKLIYDDGAFAQHSMNYHRVMLHDYLWALQLGELNHRPLTDELKLRVERAGEFLFQVQDERTGSVPCYGQNDGGLILPLNNCEYDDFRPVVTATRFFSSGTRAFPNGRWDEDLLWLFGPNSLGAPSESRARENLEANVGGYYTLRARSGFAFTRCANFRHRPGQADMLHVDIWWRGENVALDGGTFSYNAPPPWANTFSQTEYHNTVCVDGLNQMEMASRFLWLPWLASRVNCTRRSAAGALHYWEGEHDGYKRLRNPVRHRRGIIRIGEENWIVIDVLNSTANHDYRLQWLLADVPHEWNAEKKQLTLQTGQGAFFVNLATAASSAEATLVRADEKSPRGWRAPYYGTREPALSLAFAGRGTDYQFFTFLGSETPQLQVTDQELRVHADLWEAAILLSTDDMLAKSIAVAGSVCDHLDLF